MDRIAALRNVEDTLAEFEDGEVDLAGLERRVRSTLRTYATELDGELRAYRATGDDPADGVIVLAPSAGAARERAPGLFDDDLAFEMEPVER